MSFQKSPNPFFSNFLLIKKKSFTDRALLRPPALAPVNLPSPAPEMQGRIYHISFVAEEVENQRSVSQAYARKEVASRGVNVVYPTSKPK